jgi:hypothetical protein
MFSKKILKLMHHASQHRQPEFVTQQGFDNLGCIGLKNDLTPSASAALTPSM